MRKNKPNKNKVILHECLICGNKWEASFPVKHCRECGYDERARDAIGGIRRVDVTLLKASDGNEYIPLRLIRVIPKGENEDAQD